MSDLDRIKALAGLATDSVAEAADKKMVCKDCGDEMGKPTTDCENSAYDKDGDHWIEIDIDGDGDADIKIARDMKDELEEAGCDCDCGQSPCEACGETHHDVAEAVGEKAEAFYDMQDAFAGGEAEGAHKVIIDELVRYLSGDQLEDFVADFSRHYDLADMDMNEDDLDENAFNQAAAAAARDGKAEFEFNGKTYKTKMDKSTAHKLDDDVQFESAERMIKVTNVEWDADNPADVADLPTDFTLKVGIPHNADEDEVDEMVSDAITDRYGFTHKGFEMKFAEDIEDTEEEVVSEAPTMDTTQMITLLKNAGLSEEAINEKLTEWANTPEGVSEEEPTEHGDAYDFAQNVNLSLKRYLDAEDMKVGLKEHKVEDIREAYENKKKS